MYFGQNELNAFTTKSGCGKIAVELAEVSLFSLLSFLFTISGFTTLVVVFLLLWSGWRHPVTGKVCTSVVHTPFLSLQEHCIFP